MLCWEILRDLFEGGREVLGYILKETCTGRCGDVKAIL